MKKTLLVVSAIILLGLVGRLWGEKYYRPSFDCGKIRQSDKVEKFICTTKRLTELDRSLANKYRELKELDVRYSQKIYNDRVYLESKYINKFVNKAVIKEQRNWLKERKKCLLIEDYYGKNYVRDPSLKRKIRAKGEEAKRYCLIKEYAGRVNVLNDKVRSLSLKIDRKEDSEEVQKKRKAKEKEKLAKGWLKKPLVDQGVRIMCMPKVNEIKVEADEFQSRTKDEYRYLKKDKNKTYNNQKDGSLFLGIGDFTYECEIRKSIFRFEVRYVGLIESWEEDFLQKAKDSKASWHPSNAKGLDAYYSNIIWSIKQDLKKYPNTSLEELPVEVKKKGRSRTQRLRMYKDGVLILDIDRFRREMSTHAFFDTDGFVSVVFDYSLLEYSTAGSTFWVKPNKRLYYNGEVITYLKILEQTAWGLDHFRVGLGSRQLTQPGYEVCMVDKEEYFKIKKLRGRARSKLYRKFCKEYFAQQYYIGRFLTNKIEQMGGVLNYER